MPPVALAAILTLVPPALGAQYAPSPPRPVPAVVGTGFLDMAPGVRVRRTRTEGARRGALIGLVVGGVPSVALVAATAVNERSAACDSWCRSINGTAIAAALGAAFTATTTATGAVIGHNRPGWRRAPGRVDAAVLPAKGGAVLAVRVGF